MIFFCVRDVSSASSQIKLQQFTFPCSIHSITVSTTRTQPNASIQGNVDIHEDWQWFWLVNTWLHMLVQISPWILKFLESWSSFLHGLWTDHMPSKHSNTCQVLEQCSFSVWHWMLPPKTALQAVYFFIHQDTATLHACSESFLNCRWKCIRLNVEHIFSTWGEL